jgi:hypothetical protein
MGKYMSDKKFFYVSGILSFSFYCLFFLLFILYVKSHNVKKIDAFSKTTVLELDIIVDNKPKEEEKKTIQNVVKNTEKSEDIVKKSTSKSVKTSANVQSLFANVSVASQNVKKEVVNNTQKNLVASRYKSKFEKQSKNESVSVSKLLDNVKQNSSKLLVSNSKNQNDPYYSKIYELLASRWNPRVIIDDLSAKVIITIFSDGRFDYKLLIKSGNDIFDDSLYDFLESQKSEIFPPYEKGSSTDIEFTFRTKE